MRFATNNIYSIILLACSGLTIPCFALAVVGWACMQFFGWEPIHPIANPGKICLSLFILVMVPSIAAVYIGAVLHPEAANPDV